MNRMMLTAALALTLGLAATTARAGDYDKSIVPADSIAVVHVDFQAFLEHDFGKLVIADLKAVGLDERIEKVKQELGLDPLLDFSSATLYGNGWDHDDWVMTVRMSANVGKLRELARSNADYESTTYNGHTIHSWIDRKRNKGKRKYCGEISGAPLNETMLVFSDDPARVRAGMDAIFGKGDTLKRVSEGPLAADPDKGATVFIAAKDIQTMPENKPRGPMLRIADTLVASMGEADGNCYARMSVMARSAEEAAQMRALANGMLAMVALGNQPQAQNLAALAASVKIGGGDKEMTLRFEHDARDLHARLKAMHEAKHGRHRE